ncbi:hypothetical protein [Butyrivibrio proteoclasticus]|uniref:hypothetical protein n=1 Tax=Butyrivibrio proteoclasticus TaxID=43305 RepID=UPI00047CA342|nr:hypothetical protein [Butyrivibrio proteoclasticus]
MSNASYAIGIPFVAAFVFWHLFQIIRFKTAVVCEGKVIRSLGTDTHHYRYGLEYYETYEVEFCYKGNTYKENVYTSETSLRPGDHLDVHIKEDKDGDFEVLPDKYCYLTRDLVVMLFLVIIICAIAIAFAFLHL